MQDVRRTVTFLFTDIVNSSKLGLTLDPEALRTLLTRYFSELSAVIVSHGGTIQKYVGDAIMAVFGVPVLHEDDALRAVRSALEIRHKLNALNAEFMATWGVHLAHRIGINTGEVFVGEHLPGELFITGEVVNFTKRLEEAAAADEILIGDSTHRLVRDAINVEPSGPRAIKHGATIHGYVVCDPVTAARASDHDPQSTFVGREHERALLQSLFDQVSADKTCQLITVLGNGALVSHNSSGSLRKPSPVKPPFYEEAASPLW